MSRYHRQTLLPQIGEAGQEKLRASRVLLVGCGALGTVIAEQLVRAGVGHLRLCDRDVVEMSNLQRQTLFTEADAEQGVPKAVAAGGRLAAINSSVAIEPHVEDVHSGNIETLAAGIHVIVDGTDNVETRYLVNDVAVKLGLPWVYGACVGMGGRVMGVVPGVTVTVLVPSTFSPFRISTTALVSSSSSSKRTSTWLRTTSFSTSTPSAAASRAAIA